jgi:hypothetical protein
MALFTPFDNNPVNNDETATSYTVPPGKFAIISVTLSVYAHGFVDESGAQPGAFNSLNNKPHTVSNNDSTTITLRLKSGEVLTKQETAASASTSTSGGGTGKLVASSSSSAAALVGGTQVAYIACSGYAMSWDSDPSANADMTASVAGGAYVKWSVAEYNNIA